MVSTVVPFRVASGHKGPERMEEASAAVDLLFERFLDDVFSYALSRVQDRSAAEDITAETFTVALAAWPKFRRDSSEKVWLLGIAQQKVAEAVRRHERKQRRERLEGDLTEGERETLGLVLAADVRQLPEDAALREEARAVMRGLLARLPALQRVALLLQVEEGLSMREIAQNTGRTVDATESLLRRARATIFRLGRHYFAE